MGQAIPKQHPAVVLHSHFNQLRVLLALALVALCGLTAVVILASDDRDRSARSATHGSATLTQRAAPATFDPNSIKQAPGVRYDGGPEEGTRGAGH
jgi:hypothetical protein